jgi:hypothetical protein
MGTSNNKLTAFGAWVAEQPRGVLTKAMLATGLAWTTVHGAQRKLVTLDVARALSRFTRGAVKARDIAIPPRQKPARV